jgi:hypothetical protein
MTPSAQRPAEPAETPPGPDASRQRYRYVGPDDLLASARATGEGAAIAAAADLGRWLASRPPAERDEPFTFVVGLDGVLRLAPRRSEHVACAGGRDVLAAGEIRFAREGGGASGWAVVGVSNQSTGYCPDPGSWTAVAAAFGRAGLAHPGHFTDALLFRRCPGCGERNVVKDGHFYCALCDAALPAHWNFGSGP